MSGPPIGFSVDVEDWFQTANLAQAISRNSWETRELRVAHSTRALLDLLDRFGAHATFFVLGWIAERLPELVRDIGDRGHEVASHGHSHRSLAELGPAGLRDEAGRTKALLENITGRPCLGFRAPNFSITRWALPILAELGYTYDSSYHAVSRHPRYGHLDIAAPPGKTIVEVLPGFSEVLVSPLPLGGIRVGWAGGAYFRLIPFRLFQLGIDRIRRRTQLYVFYIHPWELDADQPRVPGRFSAPAMLHYANLRSTIPKLEHLLSRFRTVRLCDVVRSGQVPLHRFPTA